MPKIKTRKMALKRFKLTKKGKVLRGSQYSRHRRAHKSKRQIRRYSHSKEVLGRQKAIIRTMI